jgi:hypothetical protein
MCNRSKVYTGYCDEDFEQGAKWQQQASGRKSAEQLNLLYSMKNSTADTFTDKDDRIKKNGLSNLKK